MRGEKLTAIWIDECFDPWISVTSSNVLMYQEVCG